MVKNLLLILSIIVATQASAQTKLYDFTQTATGAFPAAFWNQKGTSEAAQAIFFDDIQIPTAVLGLTVDSIDITAMAFGIVRGANAPATKMNLWYARVNGAAANYNEVIITPPTRFGSIELSANAGAATGVLIRIGDSVSPVVRIPADTGIYAPGLTSFFFGISFEDTTGNGVFLGTSDGASVNDINAVWLLDPTISPNPVEALGFNNIDDAIYATFYGLGQTLPVTYAQFEGRKTDKGARLSWQTVTEQNNHGFELERSADGKQFSRVAFVPTKAVNGNSNHQLAYSYDDNSLAAAGSFYRLKQLDYDGKYQYSKVVFIRPDADLQFSLAGIYPNPTSSNINLAVEAAEAGQATIGVIDISGRRLQQTKIALPKGYSNQQLKVNGLPGGVYRVILQSGEGRPVISQPFIKQ